MQDEVLSFTVTKNKALKEVGIWNKLSQPCNNQEIKDITEFGRAFDVWWFNLQPAAHVKSGHLLPATDEINQRKTNKVGKGGFVLVMLMLTWQRVACGETSSEWDLAVGNVIEVLWQIRSCPLSKNHANTPCPMICFQSQGHQNMFQSTQCVYFTLSTCWNIRVTLSATCHTSWINPGNSIINSSRFMHRPVELGININVFT